MKITLADKFIKLTQNQDLYPPVYNVPVFTPRISGHMHKKYYKDTTPTPYLTIMKKGQDSIIFLPETKFKNIAEEIFKKYWKQTKFLAENRKAVDKHVKALNKLYLLCNHNYITRAKSHDIIKKAREIMDANRHLNSLIWFTICPDKIFFKQLLRKLNINIPPARFSRIWPRAVEPAFRSFDKTRHLYILRLLSGKNGWNSIAERCQYFFANYDKVEDLSAVRKKLNKEYGRISSSQAAGLISREESNERKRMSSYEKWFRTLNKEEQKLVAYIQEIIRIRDARKNAVSQTLTVAHRVAKKLFKEAGLSGNLMQYCSSDEILRGKNYLIKNRKGIIKRPNGIAMFFILDSDAPVEFEYKTYKETKNKLLKYCDEKLAIRTGSDLQKIKGQIACVGKVEGEVKIVHNPSKAKNFRKGNILVTSMTRPEFVPLIKKSSAIITNEGGITSHAAIISRELSIPCIIGTKIATQVLKDGDLIEVDANNGIIKILNK